VHIRLSNHSDFNGLVEFAVNSRTRRIHTVYGYSERLARHLRLEYGLSSYPIPDTKCLTLFALYACGFRVIPSPVLNNPNGYYLLINEGILLTRSVRLDIEVQPQQRHPLTRQRHHF